VWRGVILVSPKEQGHEASRCIRSLSSANEHHLSHRFTSPLGPSVGVVSAPRPLPHPSVHLPLVGRRADRGGCRAGHDERLASAGLAPQVIDGPAARRGGSHRRPGSDACAAGGREPLAGGRVRQRRHRAWAPAPRRSATRPRFGTPTRADVERGRVGFIGVSVGASLALCAAEDGSLAGRVSAVAGIAPYADLEDVSLLATTGYVRTGIGSCPTTPTTSYNSP
jgi:hypothetical protein